MKKAWLVLVAVMGSTLATGEEGNGTVLGRVRQQQGKQAAENKCQCREQRVKRRAFVSFLESSNNGFLKGAIALGYTIKNNSGYFPLQNEPDMVLMTLNDFKGHPRQRKALEKVGWTIKPVPAIKPFKRGFLPRYKNVFTKLHIWNMTDWDSIFYMDSDMLVKKPLGDIFDLIEASGAWSFISVNDLMDQPTFNVGVMGIRPDASVFKNMLKMAGQIDYNPFLPEQGFLNEYFKHKWLALPKAYNLIQYPIKYPDSTWKNLWNDATIVHYACVKPWDSASYSMYNRVEKTTAQYWLKVFNEACKSLGDDFFKCT